MFHSGSGAFPSHDYRSGHRLYRKMAMAVLQGFQVSGGVGLKGGMDNTG